MRGLSWVGALLAGCATIQAPTGGPPDTEAPRLKAWTHYTDKKSRVHYKLRWNEFLDLAGEGLPTLVWISPIPSDTMPLLWRRIRGKRLYVRTPPSSEAFLWVGPGLRDFTEKNAITPLRLPEDSTAVTIYLEGATASKHAVWLLVQRPEGFYWFLAVGDSVRLLGLRESPLRAYAWEDLNGNGLWDGANEKVWLPLSDTGSMRVWRSTRLDTMLPRPVSVTLWQSYKVLRFSEPIICTGSCYKLSEKVVLSTDTVLRLKDSLGCVLSWRVPEGLQPDTSRSLFWSWERNIRSPWLYVGVLDTSSRADTFFHLVEGSRDVLLAGCVEPFQWIIAAEEALGEGTLQGFAMKSPIRLPLRKAPILIAADSGQRIRLRFYPFPILDNSAFFEAYVGDTLWLVPGRYHLRPIDSLDWRVHLEGRWPQFVGQDYPLREITVSPTEALQVFRLFPERP